MTSPRTPSGALQIVHDPRRQSFRALRAVEARGLDLVAEPGALALGELTRARRGSLLCLGARDPAGDQVQRLVVADRVQAPERRLETVLEQRARLLDQTPVEHRSRPPLDAFPQG